jgi:hypothetical protein
MRKRIRAVDWQYEISNHDKSDNISAAYGNAILTAVMVIAHRYESIVEVESIVLAVIIIHSSTRLYNCTDD